MMTRPQGNARARRAVAGHFAEADEVIAYPAVCSPADGAGPFRVERSLRVLAAGGSAPLAGRWLHCLTHRHWSARRAVFLRTADLFHHPGGLPGGADLQALATEDGLSAIPVGGDVPTVSTATVAVRLWRYHDHLIHPDDADALAQVTTGALPGGTGPEPDAAWRVLGTPTGPAGAA